MRKLTGLAFAAVLPLALLAQTRAPEDALDGLDPVLLVQGKEVFGKSAITAVRGDFVYLFSTEETKATFEKNPEKYEIQMGGLCARMGRTTGGNPGDFVVHEGKIYIFGSDACHKKFAADPAKYIPRPAEALPTSADALSKGRALVERVVTAFGGAKQVDRVTTLVESGSQTITNAQGEMTVATRAMWRFPDAGRLERTRTVQGKQMTAAQVLSPQGMWFVAPQGRAYHMREASRPSLTADFGRHPLAIVRARREAGFKAAALGATTLDKVRVERVRVVSGPIDVVLNLEESGRLHSLSFRERGGDGEYGDYSLMVLGLSSGRRSRPPVRGTCVVQRSTRSDADVHAREDRDQRAPRARVVPARLGG